MPRFFFGSWIRTQFPVLSQQAVLPIEPFLQTIFLFLGHHACKWSILSHTSRPTVKVSLKNKIIITIKLKYKEVSLLSFWFVIWGYFLVRSKLSITHRQTQESVSDKHLQGTGLLPVPFLVSQRVSSALRVAVVWSVTCPHLHTYHPGWCALIRWTSPNFLQVITSFEPVQDIGKPRKRSTAGNRKPLKQSQDLYSACFSVF